ncbi:MAG: hypothetical protein EOP00_21475 [Pedobacter sp.]|nr:MAG: hypothetical protein EOP00_21475 [Pedobacter sp.]
MKVIFTLFFLIFGIQQGVCQLIGKTRDQILKINYAKPRKLVTIDNNVIVFKEGEVQYCYMFVTGSDSCVMQALRMPISKLDATVKEYTGKYKLVGPMSWVDKNSKFIYTVITDMDFVGPSPDGKEYFAVKIQNYDFVLMEYLINEINSQPENDKPKMTEEQKKNFLRELNSGTPKQ